MYFQGIWIEWIEAVLPLLHSVSCHADAGAFGPVILAGADVDYADALDLQCPAQWALGLWNLLSY